MSDKTRPRGRPPQCPIGIVIRRTWHRFTAQHLVQIADGASCAEANLAEVELVAVLQRAEQFDAIERTKSEVGVKICVCSQRADRATRDATDQAGERTARVAAGSRRLEDVRL